MKASTILVAIFSASAMANTIPIAARQEEPLPQNVDALQKAREDSADAIKRGDGQGRRLGEDLSGCSELCDRCRTAATAKAVAEVIGCGTALVIVDVLTAGLSTFLEAAGFVSCEAAVIAILNQNEEACLKE
ncbi:hypothetical protein BKA65DRAFT_103866 [Rhexocercosporidium sp. MPI-PUGE-AT-0058]|nr:hypothetical protein BKA65DRAFT_103866 [Rhexocercosporidium sp. MPI-PUGE-AT-0058]